MGHRGKVWHAAAGGLVLLGAGAGTAAAAATKVDDALGVTLALLFVAFVIWIVGSMFSYHKYDAGGPKGAMVEED